ncbi:hypothetical protein [Frankia sp. AgB32]|uniref:hypothetical protein n=1 Tax=Frankia sp. AgB32 TaxID=631119 RepID=UPI00200CDF13|nr:hypothetical protein [Frankia sp. AgB32]MCK9897714.1 hypothetical protein [Frankia sp. AgB32]
MTGINAEEVAQVARRLAHDVSSRPESRALRTPRVCGTFYLVCVIAASSSRPSGRSSYARTDRIGERNFVALIGDTLRHLTCPVRLVRTWRALLAERGHTTGRVLRSIDRHGRWNPNSPTVMTYIRTSDLWRDNPLRGVGL